ncbi:hypothetical protein BCR44DRAFT_58475 [Catenaria anguillulae PL171]|uniref:RING-type domain-containing protein n=1 Tax=Catenaria anguillulae PL171 TaxID=765915 RepID=A0A1Y2HXA5_9FUNG|nr:hypothetical protein BCR44DRAFT_58475 [Catenaria anguillulae PL171]
MEWSSDSGHAVAGTVTGVNSPLPPPDAAAAAVASSAMSQTHPYADAHPPHHRVAPPTLLSFAFSRYALTLGLWTMIRSRVRDMIAPRRQRELPPIVTLGIRLPVILFLISRLVWLWNAICESKLGSQWDLHRSVALADFFPSPGLMEQEDLLFHTFLVNMVAVTVDMWVHANTRIGPFDMESIPSFAEWGLASYLHPDGPDILVCNLILTLETLVLQILACSNARFDKRYRLIPTTIAGILSLVHFLLRFRYPTFPAMVALAKWPEVFSITIITFVTLAYALARITNPGGMRERPASVSWSMLPKVSDTYSPALFKLAGAMLNTPQMAPLRYESDPVFLTLFTPPMVTDDFGQFTTARAGEHATHLVAGNPFSTQHDGQAEDGKHSMMTRSRAEKALGASNHYVRAMGLGKVYEIVVHLGASCVLAVSRFVARRLPRNMWLREFVRARLVQLMPLFLRSTDSSQMATGASGSSATSAGSGQGGMADTINGLELDDVDDEANDPLFQFLPEDDAEDDDDVFLVSSDDEDEDDAEEAACRLGDHPSTTSIQDVHRVDTLQLNDTQDLLMVAAVPDTEVADLCAERYHALVQTLPAGYISWRSTQIGLRAGPIAATQRDLYLPLRMDESIADRLQSPPPPPAHSTPNCVVCRTEPRTILLHPCGCYILCDDCRQTLAQQGVLKCPTCRRGISSFSRVFQP